MPDTPPYESSTITTHTSTIKLRQAPVRKPVLYGSALAIIVIALCAIFAPDQTGAVLGTVVAWISQTFGWYFVLTAGVVVTFVLWLAFSAAGRTKLGPDHSKPQYNMFTWASMLFAAGIGIDLMFFAVAEPVAQYMGPPSGDGETVAAARQAIVWTFFHYGPVGWAMYALLGGAFAFFAYRRNLPLNIRSLLTPIFGKRVNGRVGDTVDIFAILGTIFGISVTLGIGVVQLSYGLHVLLGTPEGLGMQIALIVLSVAIATISTVSGVDKGIRRLSELNVILAIVMLVWVVVTGNTRRMFDGLVMNVGDFVASFPGMLLDTFAWERPDDWMQGWTLFFWAWWVAWAPFVGLFLARISRGRSLREFVVSVLVIPFAFIAIFISILGNSALELVLGGDADFADAAMNAPERAFFDLLQQYPAAPALIGLALITGLLFYVTSADSGALVLATLSSKIDDPRQDAPKPLRVFWSFATGLLTLGMLLVGGVPALQQATVIIGLPVSLLLYLVMISLFRALRTETHHRDSYAASASSRSGHAREGWRDRIKRSSSYPSRTELSSYLDTIAAPALSSVADELRAQGFNSSYEVSDSPVPDVPSLTVTVPLAGSEQFTYQVYPVAHTLPNYAPRRSDTHTHYYRLEVFTATGSHGYDVYEYTKKHLIGDVLSHFESHVEYLRLSADGKDSSAILADAVIPEWHDDFKPITDHETASADHTGQQDLKE